MSDLYVAMVYLAFMLLGFTAPFLWTVAYMWVDVFSPQLTSKVVAMVPSSAIAAGLALVGYFVMDRRSPARFTAHTALTLLLGGWVTLTLTWAEIPSAAETKWDWAFKTIMFSAFIPLVIRSRVQIESFLQVFVFALVFSFMPLGLKTMVSGSAYGRALGVVQQNSGLAESSTLSAVCIAIVPIVLFLRNHAVLIPKSKYRDVGYFGIIGLALVAAIGTYARTAIVGFAILGVFMWVQSKHKVMFAGLILVVSLALGAITTSSWEERISTTADYNQESSALARILVWQWTLGYVMEHPGGGGFEAYRINRLEMPIGNSGATTIIYGRAYHNAYFEMLGEQGFPGLFMYLAIQGLSLHALWSTGRRTRGRPDLLWLHDLSRALLITLVTIMACSNFVGIAFQAFYWYFLALPICLREYLYRVEKAEREQERGVIPQRSTAARGLAPVAPAR